MSHESQISCIFGTLGVALPQAPHGITVRSPIDGNLVAALEAWKNCMRRATNTINYETGLPLAQGIRFEV